MTSDSNELERGLAKQRDVVTNEILNEEAQRAKREIENRARKGNKAQAFSRKNKRRKRRRNK